MYQARPWDKGESKHHSLRSTFYQNSQWGIKQILHRCMKILSFYPTRKHQTFPRNRYNQSSHRRLFFKSMLLTKAMSNLLFRHREMMKFLAKTIEKCILRNQIWRESGVNVDRKWTGLLKNRISRSMVFEASNTKKAKRWYIRELISTTDNRALKEIR